MGILDFFAPKADGLAYDPMQLPAGANPESDPVIGYDELGQRIRRSRFDGTEYLFEPTAPKTQSTIKGMYRALRDDPTATATGLLGGMAQGVLDTISVPRRAMEGEPITYGDIADVAGLLTLGSSAGTAPEGALRAGLARTGGERFTIRGSDYFDPANPNAGRAKDPALFSPFSSTKHTTPPNEFFVAGTDLGGLETPTIVSPSDIQKMYDRIYFATGDRTSNRRSIEEINDIILRDPTITYGGPEYMDQLRAWASEPNAMTAKANALQELPANVRALLTYMPMGERSGDFSDHMAKTYGAVTKTQMGGNMAPALREVSKINKLIAEKFPNLEGVPSVASEAFPVWLSSLKGGQKAKIVKAFDQADFKGFGMPDVSAVRFAITNPDLVNSDALSVGYRMSAPDASGGIVRSAEHPSYGAYLPMAKGTTNMSLGYELPWWVGARDTALPKIKPGGPIYALPKDIKSYMGNPQLYQNIDNQWVDESSTYGGLLSSEGKQAATDYALGLLKKNWKTR